MQQPPRMELAQGTAPEIPAKQSDQFQTANPNLVFYLNGARPGLTRKESFPDHASKNAALY